MARSKKKQYEKEILQVIERKKIMRFSHIFLFYKGCSRATAYNQGLDKLDSIRVALRNNREHAVNYMLQKWIASDNTTLQIAAMRMLADEDDRRKLNQQYVEYKENQSDKKITQIEIIKPENNKKNEPNND
jgi:hypothetical protein